MAYRVGLLTKFILDKVEAERERQLDKWGPQHHPDGTPAAGDQWAADFMRDKARERCKQAAAEGRVDWNYILTEEFMEARAETDPEALTKELIQVAAVAVAWAEDIRSRK